MEFSIDAIVDRANDDDDADDAAPPVLAMSDNGNYSDSDDSDSSSYDAFEEVFKQGEYLRLLRQMALEDEASREKDRQLEQEQQQGEEENDDGNSNTLVYKNYLRNQRGIYDDFKHVNFQYLDFGAVAASYQHNSSSDSNDNSDGNDKDNDAISSPPLMIEQDRSLGKGGFIWDAGVILAESVLRMEAGETEWLNKNGRNNKNPTKIIELGAGTGITSLLIAAARPSTTVHLTDLPLLLPLLERNCRNCCPKNATATCGVLEWGKQPFGDGVDAPYDIVLAADVVASIYDSSGLAKTIYDLSHGKTVVYLSAKERLSGVIDRFESYMRELFTVVERMEADSDNKNPDVFILRITGKRIYN
eukprot:CAMPEP_0168165232 /NCGR_PEP_ID=MMETSP0139_2-20121125/1376_1 /TAXON_ID=44445 /ORGANISM="Pseudo-nitzschia australis, Strain 10249 10 AB" /LENGTH=359 /DNA_ID=CAMNT_0008082333 /DNA_START=215 /DNA_END=1294 /DNA_ORIENTATION=-